MAIQRNLFTGSLLFSLFLTSLSGRAEGPEGLVIGDGDKNVGVLLERAIAERFTDVNEDGLPDLFEPLVSKRAFKTEASFERSAPLLRQQLSEVYKDPVENLAKDFAYLARKTFPSDAVMAKKWGLKDTTSQEWQDWFRERVHVITSGDSSDMKFWESRFEEDVEIDDKSKIGLRPLGAGAVAENLSEMLVALSMQIGRALRYRGSAFPVKVWGTHFGLLQLNPMFFQMANVVVLDEKSPRFQKISLIARAYRISVLMHEARHSDGDYTRGNTFAHGVCPEGHPYAKKDCDTMQNGPYSVEADMLSLFAKTCVRTQDNFDCTDTDKTILEGLSMGAAGRVLNRRDYEKDANGNPVIEIMDPAPFKMMSIAPSTLKMKP